MSVEPEKPGLGDAVLVIDTSALVALTTRNETFVVCWSIPLIAVMVSGNVPTGVFESVVTDKVDDLAVVSVRFTDVGLNEAFAPVGKPLMLKETLPVNPLEGVAVTLYVVPLPGATVCNDGEPLTEKSGVAAAGWELANVK